MEVISWIGSSASMSGYMNAIKVAVLTFPFLAFLITIPYMISQYRKYGAIHSLRTLIIYSFVLYLLAAYFLVILPLPSMEVVESLTTSQTQLVPFAFIGDMVRESHFVWDDHSTYLGAILNPSVYVVLYNILLTIPFGMYLRYYFKKDLKTIQADEENLNKILAKGKIENGDILQTYTLDGKIKHKKYNCSKK